MIYQYALLGERRILPPLSFVNTAVRRECLPIILAHAEARLEFSVQLTGWEDRRDQYFRDDPVKYYQQNTSIIGVVVFGNSDLERKSLPYQSDLTTIREHIREIHYVVLTSLETQLEHRVMCFYPWSSLLRAVLHLGHSASSSRPSLDLRRTLDLYRGDSHARSYIDALEHLLDVEMRFVTVDNQVQFTNDFHTTIIHHIQHLQQNLSYLYFRRQPGR